MERTGIRLISGKFKWENCKEIDDKQDLHLGGKIVLKLVLLKKAVVVWIGFKWLRLKISDGLWTR